MRPLTRAPFAILLLAACGGGGGAVGDMEEYLEFYFPATTAASYNVVHDWGEYLIIAGAGPEEVLHPDSEPYRGFVIMRPLVTANRTVTPTPPIYCVTPDGEVWITTDTAAIPAVKTREEVADQGDGMTVTTTIESQAEPVIDSFRENRAIWTRVGRLEVGGGSTSFKAEP